MDIDYPGFGQIVVDGTTYDHDIVIESGVVRARDKTPSRRLKGQYGHTPLTSDEEIPWSGTRLIVGSGYSGRLPVLDDLSENASSRGVSLDVLPTSEACAVISTLRAEDVTAILHVTC